MTKSPWHLVQPAGRVCQIAIMLRRSISTPDGGHPGKDVQIFHPDPGPQHPRIEQGHFGNPLGQPPDEHYMPSGSIAVSSDPFTQYRDQKLLGLTNRAC
jgi:hypothetical protein